MSDTATTSFAGSFEKPLHWAFKQFRSVLFMNCARAEFPEEKLVVLLDAGHFYQMGIDPSDAASMLGHRLLDVHVHDAKIGRDCQKATHLPIGKGTMDFPRFVTSLAECGYEGHLTLGVRGSESDIIESKSYLENLIGST